MKYIPLVCWTLALAACLLAPIKIISYGYVPVGDARRYVAKAMTDKQYPDIVVSGPVFHMDFSPGWEWLLRQARRLTHCDEDTLMAVSVAVLLILIFVGALPWLRYPEAWMAALLAVTLPYPGLLPRLASNRPLVFTEAVLICILAAWTRDRKITWLKRLGTCAGFALAGWVHGTWYLYGLVMAAFFLAGWWRTTLELTACWLVGTVLGAALTGHPWGFLAQNFVWGLHLAGEAIPASSLVGELQPSSGAFEALAILALAWLWRRQDRPGGTDLFRSPLFWMMALCWALSLRVERFWSDWGSPAAMVWLATQFEDGLRQRWTLRDGRRLVLCVLVTLGFFLNATSDISSRYTNNLHEPIANAKADEMKGWLPGPGGIFYSADFSFFFDMFYKYPEGDWRYILGYEPAIMPEEDLKIFRAIQFSDYDWRAYAPWVAKMRPQDRLEITSGVQPSVPPLQWFRVGGNIWIGRLPGARSS